MDTLALLQGIRFIDSFFPSGGFAFSSGLEAAVQAAAVRNADELSRYVEDCLRLGLGTSDAVAVARAHRAATKSQVEFACEADRELEAMKLCRELRGSSRQMGRQVIRMAASQISRKAMVRDFAAHVQSERSPGHLAVCLGLTLGTLGWTRQAAVAAFLYQSAVGFVSAALKLLPIGQREAQGLLVQWTPLIDLLSRAAESRTDMTSWLPVQDIYAMRHRRLPMRLFRS